MPRSFQPFLHHGRLGVNLVFHIRQQITSKEVSFTSVALKNLQHILKPVKYRDLMAKKSKPVLERDVPPAHGQKVLKENTLTWHLKYVDAASL